MQLNKIPATIVTGFLGSGKTTLLSNMIKQANGKRIAVVVNEFGELDIDADMLRHCPIDGCEDNGEAKNTSLAEQESGVYELSNGCICCTVEEEFLPVMKKLLERREDIDHILIETSGLALPKPLVQAFNWPEVKQFCTVDAVITVLDGPAVADGRMANNPEQIEKLRLQDENLDHDPTLQELLEDQLGSADLVIVSKTDLLNSEQQKDVEATIRAHVKDEIKTLNVSNGEISSDLIMGLDSATEDRIEAVHSHHDHHHAHGDDHHHAHDHFNSVSLELGEMDADKTLALIHELIAENTIYRVKGFLALPNKPMRQILQGVGTRIDQYFDRMWLEGETRTSRLVFIGKELDENNIKNCLAPACV